MAIPKVSVLGSKVDLTLQSIHGIRYVAKEGGSVPQVTAAVSFQGSASDMQVSSFTMCGHTGNLVVQSNGMAIDRGETSEDPQSSKSYGLFATFNDPQERRCSTSSSLSTSSSSSRPHLKLKLSKTNPRNPSLPLGKINRDSRIVPEHDVEADAVSRFSGELSNHTGGASVQWEADGSAMPDIVELHITLRNEDNTVCEEGVAHLVFFGTKRELGATTMELPIKRKEPLTPNESESRPSLSFLADAKVRVQVVVVSDDPPKPKRKDKRYSEKKLQNIMLRLNENEEMAAARAQVVKMQLGEKDAKKQDGSRFLCSGFDFRETIRCFVDAFKRCDGAPRRTDKGHFFTGLRTTPTMDSTIATRDSMLV